MEKYHFTSDARNSLKNLSSKDKLDLICQYLDTHYVEPEVGKLPDLAHRFSLSKRTLTRLFRREKSLTVKAYIENLRLKFSMKLLTGTQLPIQEVAELSGYKAHYYFSKVFKRKFKLTPKTVRAMLKKGYQDRSMGLGI